MKQKFYTPGVQKTNDKVLVIGLDIAHLPSQVHKYGALNNKSKVFDDRRKKKPKYKSNYLED